MPKKKKEQPPEDLWVPMGHERQELQDKIAAERAELEIEFEGRDVGPLDYGAVVEAARRLSGENVYISQTFVNETRRRVPHWKRVIQEYD